MPTATAQPARQELTSRVAASFDHWKHLVAESFVPAEYNAYKDAVPFVVLLVVLLVRPQGLLGRAQVQKV